MSKEGLSDNKDLSKVKDKKNEKVLIIGNSHLVVLKFRKEIVQKLVEEGYEVWVSFPNGPFGEGEKSSKEFGCNFIETKISRRGKNPFKDVSLSIEYYSIIKKIKPDIVLGFTVKCDIYGGIISRILKVPFIPNITGLGKGLVEGRFIRMLTIFLYKSAVKKSKIVFFQNRQDELFFKKNNIEFERSTLLPGSGVNLDEFIPLEYPVGDIVRFIYVARVMKAKGIEEYLEAARVIKSKYKNTEFHICGYCEEDYKEILKEYENKGIIKYHGLVQNVIEYEKICHCIVLPSFHPEGISNVLLEGAACARPLITTNRTGCKETINDEISGYLILERDSSDLIEKIEKFLKLTNDEKRNMGLLGRAKVEQQFDRKFVVREYLNEIQRAIKGEG